MPVTFTVSTGSGVFHFTVEDSLASQSFVFHVPAAPTSVELDKNEWILKTVEQVVTNPTFNKGVLLVNGVSGASYRTEITTACQDKAFWGDYTIDFWDTFASGPAGGYPSTLPAPIGRDSATTTRDVVLSALSPKVTRVTAGLDAGEVRLTWPHLSPNTGYELHRGADPYFAPESGTRVAAFSANHPPAAGESLSHRDAESGAGDAKTNNFYVVVATNAAGAAALSGRTGEFDFAIVTPESQSCAVYGETPGSCPHPSDEHRIRM